MSGVQGQRLQQAALDLRLHHDLVVRQRDVDIREGQGAVFLRDKGLAGYLAHDVEHLLVEHVPGAYLLLDHVETGLFEFCRVHVIAGYRNFQVG